MPSVKSSAGAGNANHPGQTRERRYSPLAGYGEFPFRESVRVDEAISAKAILGIATFSQQSALQTLARDLSKPSSPVTQYQKVERGSNMMQHAVRPENSPRVPTAWAARL